MEFRAPVLTGPPSREEPRDHGQARAPQAFLAPRRLPDAQPGAGEQRLTGSYCFIPGQVHGKADSHLTSPLPRVCEPGSAHAPRPTSEPCTGALEGDPCLKAPLPREIRSDIQTADFGVFRIGADWTPLYSATRPIQRGPPDTSPTVQQTRGRGAQGPRNVRQQRPPQSTDAASEHHPYPLHTPADLALGDALSYGGILGECQAACTRNLKRRPYSQASRDGPQQISGRNRAGSGRNKNQGGGMLVTGECESCSQGAECKGQSTVAAAQGRRRGKHAQQSVWGSLAPRRVSAACAECPEQVVNEAATPGLAAAGPCRGCSADQELVSGRSTATAMLTAPSLLHSRDEPRAAPSVQRGAHPQMAQSPRRR
ncbi:unnamed protein product [Rangifer tarandus platyrhynchus]|uniref:Uncharacterized protein n=1 Tax=Rangifer tarandus platyrhynchus TaxID=3082113 RepID=A0AC59Z6A5_RANTA